MAHSECSIIEQKLKDTQKENVDKSNKNNKHEVAGQRKHVAAFCFASIRDGVCCVASLLCLYMLLTQSFCAIEEREKRHENMHQFNHGA